MPTDQPPIDIERTPAISTVLARLDERDDPVYWRTLIDAVLQELDARWSEDPACARALAVCVARVSRWMRPNQKRWTSGGGFAYPESYSSHAERETDWRVWLTRVRSDRDWRVTGEPGRSRRGHYRALLIAPAGTARHPQGAAQIVWRPDCPFRIEGRHDVIRRLYGLRRSSRGWEVVADGEYGPRSGA